MFSTVQKQIKRLDRPGFGPLPIMFQAMRTFMAKGALEAASSLAYYAFFSVFPLLLLLISVSGAALASGGVQDQLFQLTTQFIPVSQDFLENTIAQVLERRGTVGLVGIIGLAWSASSAFSVLVKHINQAWPNAQARGTLHRRFLGIGITFLLAFLLLIWLASSTLLDLLPRLLSIGRPPDDLFRSTEWLVLSNLLPLLLTVLMFYGLYRLIPRQTVSWSAAFWGAVSAALAWEVAANVFNLYVSSGFANFSLVYGSLGAIVSFLLWIYISSVIVLLGAHVTSAVDFTRDETKN